MEKEQKLRCDNKKNIKILYHNIKEIFLFRILVINRDIHILFNILRYIWIDNLT